VVGDDDRAVGVDVDRRSGLFLDGANVLATRADQQTNLVRSDLDLGDAWGEWREVVTRLRDRFGHGGEKDLTAVVRLGERLARLIDPSGTMQFALAKIQPGETGDRPKLMERALQRRAELAQTAGDCEAAKAKLATLDGTPRSVGLWAPTRWK